MSQALLRTPTRLIDLVRQHGGELDRGLADRSIDAVAPARHAKRGEQLTLAVSGRALAELRDPRPIVLVSKQLASRIVAGRRWVHDSPWWAMAGVLENAIPNWPAPNTPLVAPDASIAGSSVIHETSSIGPGCRLEANAVIAAGVKLGARVVVGANTVIGRPGFGFAHTQGKSARRIPQLGGVVVEDDVEFGALCTVDAGTLEATLIGAGTKLDSQVHIGHNVRLGRSCLLAAQVGIAGSAELGDGVWIGGQAGVADHVRIGNGARIAAKSGVIADIAAGATVAGFPAVDRWRWLRGAAWLLRPHKPSSLGS